MNAEAAEAFISQAKHHLTRDFLPKLRACVKLLSDEQIWWRANENTNSVGNLLLHLAGNVRQWIIAGMGTAEDTRKRDAEFSARGPIPGNELLEKLESAVTEAVAVLDSVDRTRLLEKRPIQIYDVTGLQAIFHVVEHFSYHTGQIIYITRLLKNVDLKFYRL